MIEDEWPDERLVDTYKATGGESGNAEADALLAEIARRRLDV
jgi:hypothetical protein